MSYKKYWRGALILLVVGVLAFGTSLTAFSALVDPVFVDSPQDPVFADCTAYKTKADPVSGKYYFTNESVFEMKKGSVDSPLLGDSAWVEITVRETPEGQVFDWESNVYIAKVYAKGGSGGNLYDYSELDYGAVKGDEGLHAPVAPSGKYHDLSHITFYYCGVEPAVKSGYKFHDLNANGVWDVGESGLISWEINLWTEVDGELTIVDSVYTGNDADGNPGYYEFELVPGIDYYVSETIKANWFQSYPYDSMDDALYFAAADGVVWGPVNLEPGEVEEDNNFGNYQYAVKSGYKFNDLNEDGVWDEGEPGINGWAINLWAEVDGELTIVESVYTGNDAEDNPGYYEFNELMPGVDYFVSESMAPGWAQSYPYVGVDGAFYYEPAGGVVWGAINLDSGEVEEENNFGNYRVAEPNCETAMARMNDDPNDFTNKFDGHPWFSYLKLTPKADEDTFYFYAAQHYKVGEVDIWKENGNLYVYIRMADGYTLQETHINVQTSLDANPSPQSSAFGQYPYRSGVIPWNDEWDGKELYITVHGVVCGYFMGDPESEGPEENQGMPGNHGMTGEEFGKAVSDLAKSAPGAVADHVLEQKGKERPNINVIEKGRPGSPEEELEEVEEEEED